MIERDTRISTRYLDERFAHPRQDLKRDASLSLHCVRHSYVAHLIEFGYPERFVTEQVGHAFASTTAIYTSVSNDFKNKTIQAALRRVYQPDEAEGTNHEACVHAVEPAVEPAAGDGRSRSVLDQRARPADG